VKNIPIELKVIGLIHSPFKTTSEAPRQGTNETMEIEIFEEFVEGLQDIEGFSHLHVFYWLHKSKGYTLIVQTPWDAKPHGLFTTCSPHRPNPIGHQVVELVERTNNILRIKGIDAIEGTPVFDIKPYFKNLDIKENVSSGWSESKFKL
jgi:formylmethanofuran dehydrogenase subunit E